MKSPSYIAVLLSLILIIITMSPMTASAHVVINSNSDKSHAIVHVSPDDDPIAGSEAVLFFDIKSELTSNSTHDFDLAISSKYGTQSVLVEEVGARGVRSRYIFPDQGEYLIRLTAKDGSNDEIFEFSQQVSRGVSRSHSTKRLNDFWTELTMVVSLVSLAAIMVIVINRRQQILAYTHDSIRRKK